MRSRFGPFHGLGMAAALGAAAPLWAQEAAPAPTAASAAGETIDPESIPMPDLAFVPEEGDVRNYRKYFYFHRDGNDFATAYADLRECDGYARGLSHRVETGPVPYPYAGTLGGAIGGAVGSIMADAIFGSAERRQQRRIIMRTCMTYKGYSTYGLRKSLWEEFNFEEGLNRVEDDRRERLLRVQARVASGPRPQVGEMTE